MASVTRRTPAATARDRRRKRGCQESERTNQMLMLTGGVFLLILSAAGLAWWQGWIELADEGTEAAPPRAALRTDAVPPAQHPPSAGVGTGTRTSPRPQRKPKSEQVLRRVFLASNRGTINTGVWPGWGGPQDGTKVLQWAAAGVEVQKQCAYRCEFHEGDPASPGLADAVVVETVNHPKFGLDGKPMPWPKPRKGAERPLIGGFYMEPEGMYPRFQAGHPDFDEHVDFSVEYEPGSDVRVSLMCPWGRPPASEAASAVYGRLAAPYLAPSAASARPAGGGIAFFSDRGIDSAVSKRLHALAELAGERLHMFAGPGSLTKRALPAGAEGAMGSLPARLDLIGTYRAVLVAQSSTAKGWLEPEVSHALVAGAVPVVWGPPDLASLMPAADAAIDAASFGDDVGSLWAAIQGVLDRDGEFGRRQEWRAAALREAEAAAAAAREEGGGAQGRDLLPHAGRGRAFLRFADAVAGKCVHYAECRICELVHNRLD